MQSAKACYKGNPALPASKRGTGKGRAAGMFGKAGTLPPGRGGMLCQCLFVIGMGAWYLGREGRGMAWEGKGREGRK